MDDKHTDFKYFCKVCKKGFIRGRALGGHMRAHGISDDITNLNEDSPSDWEDKQGNKRMYALRTNPNRLKSCRVCENCGKEFLSWKSFLEHRKCSSDDGDSLVSSPASEAYDDDRYNDENHYEMRDYGSGANGSSKRKRSLRVKVSKSNSNSPSSENEDLALAKCLMELSNACVDPVENDVEHLWDEEQQNNMFSTTKFMLPFVRPPPHLDKAKCVVTNPNGMFECKACKKVFTSHQALGGHRASHKKVKGCYAARNDHFMDNINNNDVITHDEFLPSPKPFSSYQFHQEPNTNPSVSTPLVGAARRKLSKVHKCTVCNRIFTSGQALGGHKRCHWLTSNMNDTSSIEKFDIHEHIEQLQRQTLVLPSNILNKSVAHNLSYPVLEHDALRNDPRHPLNFEVSTEINLQSWNMDHGNATDHDHKNHEKETIIIDDNDEAEVR